MEEFVTETAAQKLVNFFVVAFNRLTLFVKLTIVLIGSCPTSSCIANNLGFTEQNCPNRYVEGVVVL